MARKAVPLAGEPINTYHIRLSETVIDMLIMNALEAYCHGDGNPRRKHLETFGFLWGHRNETEDGFVYLFVDRAVQSLSATRTTLFCEPKTHAVETLALLSAKVLPSHRFLGDFHTHPYRSLKQMSKLSPTKGYDFSNGDKEFLTCDDEYANFSWQKSANNPLMLAITVTQLKRIPIKTMQQQLRNNLWTFDIGEYRFWVNAMIGFNREHGSRAFSDSDTHVFLDLGTRGLNYEGKLRG